MLYCIRLDEMMWRIEEAFLHTNQRAGDNEMDNLQFSVGKRTFSVCKVLPRQQQQQDFWKAKVTCIPPLASKSASVSHKHFVAVIFAKDNFSRLPDAGVKYLGLKNGATHCNYRKAALGWKQKKHCNCVAIEKGDTPNLLFNSHTLPLSPLLFPPSIPFPSHPVHVQVGISPGFPSGPGSVKALAARVESSAGGTSLICSNAKLSSSASSLLNYFPWENSSRAGNCSAEWQAFDLHAAAVWRNNSVTFLWQADNCLLPAYNREVVGLCCR